jgi:hypothetical protein
MYELIKIIKPDPLDYRFYLNFLKEFNKKYNINITHQLSSFTYLPIFKYIYDSQFNEFEEEIIYLNDIYIGKPHGFYSFLFAFQDYSGAKQNFINLDLIFGKINENTINGVFTNLVYCNHLINNWFDTSTDIMDTFLSNIKYIAETMGSTLSVAQGASLINDNTKYILMSDAEIETGEFYENLLMQKKYNFDITLLIDYNGVSKQNKTINSIEDLQTLFNLYNQKAIIFDTRDFVEFYNKFFKE